MKENNQKQFVCENPRCGKIHDGSYGSGRFCSKRCRHVYIALQTKRHICNFPKRKSPYGTWKCTRCNLIFETRKQLQEHNHLLHPIEKNLSWNKGLSKETDVRVAKYCQTVKERLVSGQIIPSMKGKHLSAEQKAKISISMKKFCKEHPDRVPFVLNHSSKESYPEKYFKEVFQNEKFPSFVQEMFVNGYYLDFAFQELRLYIEIDGEQHFSEKHKLHDINRTKILKQNGWKCICRIRWLSYQKLTKEQKRKFILGLKSKFECPVV